MSNQFTQSQSFQSSSVPTVFGDQFTFGDNFQSSSQACIVDLTPPTFSGINYLRVESRGQIRAKWAAASDATAPIRYEIYIQEFTATGLFSSGNIIAITDKLQYDTFTMPDGSFLNNGSTYHVGVRAIDGVNNRDSNTVSLNAISTGILTSQDIYETKGTFTIGKNNMFQGTMWLLKNMEPAYGVNLGTASYQVYDKDGNIVIGMSETGIVADSNGQFQIAPILSTLDTQLNHYIIKTTIIMDSDYRYGYIGLVEKSPSFKINGHQSFDSSSNFIGIFWAEEEDGVHISDLTRLGVGSYDVLDTSGNVIFGFGETGITPNAQGAYLITPVPGVNQNDLNMVTGRVTIIIDGIARTTYIPVNTTPPIHRPKAVFSINALNQLQGTFWMAMDNSGVATAGLGAANYTVYDASGNVVSGLTQSGIIADGNGRFAITPTSAALLTDLTHYTVKIGIIHEGTEHVAYKGFTLLGN